MLRRKPTRQELDETDNDELDQIRREIREKAEANAEKDASRVPITEPTPREKAVQGQSVRERLGLPARTPGQ